MSLNRKLVVLLASAALIVCSGCSGINASGSVSPATFLLPGFSAVTPDLAPADASETDGVQTTPELASLN